jgi:hypothetical protein
MVYDVIWQQTGNAGGEKKQITNMLITIRTCLVIRHIAKLFQRLLNLGFSQACHVCFGLAVYSL